MNINNELIASLADKCKENYTIPAEAFANESVKRGLRNADGTGVLAGITKVGLVHGYIVSDGEKEAVEGKLYYRGYDVEDMVGGYHGEKRFGFEECSYVLLFGDLPTKKQLADYNELISSNMRLPQRFTEDVIMKAPTRNIMNKLGSCVLALYAYDENPDDISLENVLRQSITIIASLPVIAAHTYSFKRHYFDNESLTIHNPLPELSTAQNFLRIVRADGQYNEEDAKLLDMCLTLHAEHGGGNNSTFACRLLSSSDTDTYSAVSAAIGSLKGPKHGGANIMVSEMMKCIQSYCSDWTNRSQVEDCLVKILRKELHDQTGKIYGMGHAVYTKSDPRAVILKEYARRLSEKRGFSEEFALLNLVEELTPQIFADFKNNTKDMCANVDFYSGLLYKMMGIPEELYTPLFAIARVTGWCSHRIEEILTGGRIIRPGYKSIFARLPYIPLDSRN